MNSRIFSDLNFRACTASIVRVVAFDQVKLEDVTYTLVTASIWTTIEQSIGIVCACLPTVRPLIARFWKGVKKSNEDDTLRQKTFSSSIPLSRPTAQHGVQRSTNMVDDGFVRLTESLELGNGSVTAYVSEARGDNLPVAVDAIVKQQRLEQHVELKSQA